MPNVLDLDAACDANGCLTVMAATYPGGVSTLWQRRELSPDGPWSPWEGLPDMQAQFKSVTVTDIAERGLVLAVLGATDGHVWFAGRGLGEPQWSTATSLGVPPTGDYQYLGSLTLCPNSDGRAEIFVSDGGDNVLWHRSQAASGSWSAWKALPPPAKPKGPFPGAVTAARNVDGRIELFAATQVSDASLGEMWHCWQLQPGGSWSRWESLGTFDCNQVPVEPKAQTNLDGRLELFVADGSDAWHCWQVTAGDPQSWTSWRAFEPVKGISDLWDSAVNNEGITVVTKAGDGNLWTRTQSLSGAGWQDWTRIEGQTIGSPSTPVIVRAANAMNVVVCMSRPDPPFFGDVCRYTKSPAGKWSLIDKWPQP